MLAQGEAGQNVKFAKNIDLAVGGNVLSVRVGVEVDVYLNDAGKGTTCGVAEHVIQQKWICC